MQKMLVWSLGLEDPLEEEMATHSSILAWEIPWIEEPGGLQSLGSQKVGQDWVTKQQEGAPPVWLLSWDNSLFWPWTWPNASALPGIWAYWLLDWNLRHWLSLFSGLQTETAATHYLSWLSSLTHPATSQPHDHVSQFSITNLSLFITHTHTHTHTSYLFCFSGEPWLIQRARQQVPS